MMLTKSTKRVRRTKERLESDLEASIQSVINEVGYGKITVSSILEKAHIEPGVFYNRYDDLSDCLSKQTRKFDYWLEDLFSINEAKASKDDYKLFLSRISEDMMKNPGILQLLRWEIFEKSKTNHRTYNRRDEQFAFFLNNFDSKNNYEEDKKILTALLFGGIFYIASQRRFSKICSVDFRKDDNVNRLTHLVNSIVDNLIV